MNDKQRNPKDNYILLSEFKSPFNHPAWLIITGIIFLVWAQVVIWLGNKCDSNCLYIDLTPVVNGAFSLSHITMWKGYIGEMVHAPFYFLPVPVCFLILFLFFHQTKCFFRNIKEEDLSSKSVSVIERRNNRVFSSCIDACEYVKSTLESVWFFISDNYLKGNLVFLAKGINLVLKFSGIVISLYIKFLNILAI